VLGSLSKLLTDASTRFVQDAPDRIDTSGFSAAFADANKLLGAGVDLVLQALKAVVDLALEMAEEVIRAIVALLGKLLDILHKMATTRIDVPILMPFYEDIVMGGNGEQVTLLSLISLAAAVPLTIAYKALSGRDEPVFGQQQHDAFMALDGSRYTWLHNPFAPRTQVLAAGGLPIDEHVVDGLNWAGGFVSAVSAAVWGIATTISDGVWIAEVVIRGSSASLFGDPPPGVRLNIGSTATLVRDPPNIISSARSCCSGFAVRCLGNAGN
jgi:hypothetical protein